MFTNAELCTMIRDVIAEFGDVESPEFAALKAAEAECMKIADAAWSSMAFGAEWR